MSLARVTRAGGLAWGWLECHPGPHLARGFRVDGHGRAPLGHPDQARLDQVEPVEELAHLRIVARCGLLRHQLVQAAGHAGHVAVADVPSRMADHHVAARRQRAGQLADELIGLLVVLDQVQDRGQDDRGRAAEVKRPGRLGQDRERLAQIGLDKVGSALGGADQQRASMAQHDRVVVDVDDPGLGCDRLGHLVDVAAGRHAGADVEELTQAGLAGQVADGTGQERPVGPGGGHHGRVDQHRLLGRFPVRGEVVLAAEQVVVDPRDVRDARVMRQGRPWRAVVA